ncbi:hypothetical protein ADL21_11075 [Streptomyces albus subsp. albus]|nr:hypothetical protein ADL21_11075 [Streptomyces albus subsp. albus]
MSGAVSSRSPAPSATAALADAVTDQAVRAAAASPAARGAEVQSGLVTAVYADGTVEVGVIRARRLESYQAPAVGDKTLLIQSGSGNWWAAGRTSAGTDTAWTPVTLASGFTHNGNDQGSVRYRVLTVHGTPYAHWRGGLGLTYPTSGAFLASALPEGARPATLRTVPAACSAASSVQNAMKVDFLADGTAQVVGFTTGGTAHPPWVSLNGLQYPLD